MGFLAMRERVIEGKTIKRSLAIFAAILSGLALTARLAAAGDIKIIANRSIATSSISAEEIKSVFLQTRTVLKDGSPVHPILVKSPVYSEFTDRFLGKTVEGLETYYRSLIFSGTGTIPRAFRSEAEVIAYASRTRGAITFVSASAQTPGVKTLELK